MARRNRSRSTRVITTNARQRLRSPTRSSLSFPDLTSFEDFRRWEPELTDGYPRTLPRSSTRVRRPRFQSSPSRRSLAMPRLFRPVSTGMGFTQPRRVVLCVRRGIRKQVLHAFRKAGKAGQRRPRFSVNSLIHC